MGMSAQNRTSLVERFVKGQIQARVLKLLLDSFRHHSSDHSKQLQMKTCRQAST